jgi:hypothetical protein
MQLLTKDMTLAASMSAVCPSSEVDELTVSLLTIFEHRGLSFELLETLIKQEIEETGEYIFLPNSDISVSQPKLSNILDTFFHQRMSQKYFEEHVWPRKCFQFMRNGRDLLI